MIPSGLRLQCLYHTVHPALRIGDEVVPFVIAECPVEADGFVIVIIVGGKRELLPVSAFNFFFQSLQHQFARSGALHIGIHTDGEQLGIVAGVAMVGVFLGEIEEKAPSGLWTRDDEPGPHQDVVGQTMFDQMLVEAGRMEGCRTETDGLALVDTLEQHAALIGAHGVVIEPQEMRSERSEEKSFEGPKMDVYYLGYVGGLGCRNLHRDRGLLVVCTILPHISCRP